ncbi:MAG: thioredoxin-dependent thiol peroxidase [Melioribacteraceae bacterium]|jgi:peroxiredoxin Q/BCP|nr:thioredoxin-dependent thiol peroxidase [Melioribacteraceae bacterium]
MLEVGHKAPNFTLPDSEGIKVSLSDFKDQNVILYFYPKDMTSGCTQEACDFRDLFPKFEKMNAVIIGISIDSVAMHKKFVEKYDLPFILLADEDKKVVEKYGVWKEKSMYGKKYMGIERTTFIIGTDGKIKRIFPKVKVAGHADEVLFLMKDLR